MERKLIIIIALLSALILASACSSSKKFVYLQDMEPGFEYPYDTKYEAVVHANDRLDITVSCNSPELAVPFNANGGAFQVSTSGTVTGVKTEKQGYRVDVNGDIDFPVLGSIHVEGLKVSEVTDMIRDLIIEGGYIKEPLVSLEFINFRYTVLGAVGHTGTFTVDGDRITLFEAIARAGEVSTRGYVDRVAVIREEDGERVMYMHDLRSKDVFNSPCFYLQQNDLVYVEPRYRKLDNADRGWRILSSGLLPLFTAICTFIWATK